MYANLAGDVVAQAQALVEAMGKAGIKRLVWISSLGIYDEIPGAFGEWNRQMIGEVLKSYRTAVDVLEAGDLELVVLRPAWLTNNDEIAYETTTRDEPFKGTEVSRKSVAALVSEIISSEDGWDSERNLGINKPGTDGDKPA